MNASSNANSTNTNVTLHVICAWPVSGQYGAGSRVLYYVLVAACVLARKLEWLRNACLAAALLFPAVAALHAIVLVAGHIDGAVDMDVYGAFQLCSIGILAAPLTVRLSRTYFYNPGRNIIFLWAGLILAGLLSLTVEFYRLTSSECTHDDAGNPLSRDLDYFPYENATCGLTCSVKNGPRSPMRTGAANNIYVIPSPDRLSFGTATLLAAACCIPAILLLVNMWFKILEINWKTRFGNGDEEDLATIEGTNGATVRAMKGVNDIIKSFLTTLGVPIFSAAVLAILIIGELNFFSSQVKYQTESIASVGQWAPIAGTVLATIGSLYLLLAADVEAVKRGVDPDTPMQPCYCPHCHHGNEGDPAIYIRSGTSHSPSSRGSRSMRENLCESPVQEPAGLPNMQQVSTSAFRASSHSLATPTPLDERPIILDGGEEGSSGIVLTASRPILGQGHQAGRSSTEDAGNRRKFARMLTKAGNYLGTAAHDQFDDSEFKQGKALDFPEIPGEEHRNSALPQIREQYNQQRSSIDKNGRSRAGSFTGSVASGFGVEGRPTSPRAASPHSPRSPRSSSPLPSPTAPQRPQASPLPPDQASSEPQNRPSSSLAGMSGTTIPRRRDTLEVPPSLYHNAVRNTLPSPPISSIPPGQRSPTIVVSSDADTSPHAEGKP